MLLVSRCPVRTNGKPRTANIPTRADIYQNAAQMSLSAVRLRLRPKALDQQTDGRLRILRQSDRAENRLQAVLPAGFLGPDRGSNGVARQSAASRFG